MMIDELITQIGAVIGLPALKLDERGLACVRIQDAPDLNLEYDEAAQCLHLYSVVGTLSQDSPPAVLTSLLIANAFGARTGGAAIGIDDLNGDLVLSTRIETSQMPPNTLLSLLERFVHNAEQWARRVSVGNLDGDDELVANSGMQGMPGAAIGGQWV